MKIYFVLNTIFWCICMTQMYHQNDYNVIHHHIEITYVNKPMIELTIRNVKPNRTLRTFDIDIVLKVELYGDQFKVRLHFFYFLNREYKSSPIEFDFKFCKAIENNIFGLRDAMKKVSSFLTKCPIKPGHYVFHNYNTPDDSLPPNIPEGEYMVKHIGFWGNKTLFEVRWFGGVKYRVKMRRRS